MPHRWRSARLPRPARGPARERGGGEAHESWTPRAQHTARASPTPRQLVAQTLRRRSGYPRPPTIRRRAGSSNTASVYSSRALTGQTWVSPRVVVSPHSNLRPELLVGRCFATREPSTRRSGSRPTRAASSTSSDTRRRPSRSTDIHYALVVLDDLEPGCDTAVRGAPGRRSRVAHRRRTPTSVHPDA